MQRYLPSLDILKRYHISRSTLYRWMDDPDIAFPQPVKIGSRVLWRDEDLTAFDKRISELNSASIAAGRRQ